MNKKYDVLNRLRNDLNIAFYNGEKKAQYISRVIYTALSMWVRVSTLDEDIFETNTDKIGVSKVHILNRCKPFLQTMIDIYPEINNWFYPKDSEENPIVVVRDRLYQGGDLVGVGFTTDLALPPYEECMMNKNVVLIRGFDGRMVKKTTGLMQYKLLNKINDYNIENAFDFFGMQKSSAQEFLKKHLKNLKWNRQDRISEQIFNKLCKKSFSNCWEQKYQLKNNEISLYRVDNFDFGFVKKENDAFYISQLNDYLIEQYEVRRFMYGLKCSVGNSEIARYKRYNDEKLVELKLSSKLPLKEENVLLILGWPIKNINDKTNLLFHVSVWEFVEVVLKNLSITLLEEI